MARPLLRRRCRLGCALLMFFVLPGMAEAQDKRLAKHRKSATRTRGATNPPDISGRIAATDRLAQNVKYKL